jgi:hypothetical protein
VLRVLTTHSLKLRNTSNGRILTKSDPHRPVKRARTGVVSKDKSDKNPNQIRIGSNMHGKITGSNEKNM